ncbi:MAG: hypothetical protein ACE5MG_12290 [Candidatus Methylomirabilales bacterium]
MALKTSVTVDASLSGLVQETLGHRLDGQTRPRDHFWVTDLVNPAEAYWSRKVRIPISLELERKLAYGRDMHNRAGYWFSRLPGFAFAEGKLDGGYVGIPGVAGRLDHLLNRSILEFKTKVQAPRTADQVIEAYPHDLEQVMFYGAMYPGASKTHYLVFLDNHADALFAFQIRLSDRGMALNLMRARVNLLRAALESENPSPLGQCRYFEGCRFRRAGVCGCADLDALSTGQLRRAVGVQRIEDFETSLASARREAESDWAPEQVATWDIIAPRRRHLSRAGQAPAYAPDVRKRSARVVLEDSIRRTTQLRVDPSFRQTQLEYARTLGLTAPYGLITVARAATQPEGREVVPYIGRAPKGNARGPRYLHEYYIAELAVSCAVAQSPRGVVFLVYPDENDKVVAYDVSYRSHKDLQALLEAEIDRIRRADATGDPGVLRICPPFMEAGCNEACLCVPRTESGRKEDAE